MIDDDVVDLLGQSAFMTMGTLSRVAAEHDLSLTQLRVLAILRDRRLRMSDLVGYLGLDKSTVTGLVTRAERRGLLTRSRTSTDGRTVMVTVSEAGLALAERLAGELAASLRPAVDRLSPAERRRLRDLLATMLGTDDQPVPAG